MSIGVTQELHPAFKRREDFFQQCGTEYTLLPFRFLHLDADRYIATNMTGEYAILSRSELHALVGHRLDRDSPIYECLKSRHFLMDGDSTAALDLLACKYRTLHSVLPTLTSLFMFVVTLRCEHSCPYCQVSRQSEDRKAFDMSFEHAKRAMDIMFQSPSLSIKVEFQGGEPLLNFDLIKHIVVGTKERNRIAEKNVSFVIATNLALINDSILGFCKEHNVFISTSLDGPKDLHNKNRPRPGGNSYEMTVDGIERVRSVLGQDNVAALMTTTQASLNQPEAIVDEYVERGFHSIFLRPLSPFGFARKTQAYDAYGTKEWLTFYRRGLNRIIQHNLNGRFLREDYASIILQKILTPFPTHYVDLQSPAGIGIACMAFNYDGNIFASDESRMLQAMGDSEFKIGHLDFDDLKSILSSESLISWLGQSMTESMPMCSQCGIQPYCGSDPVFHKATQGDIVGHKPSSSFCQRMMELVRMLILMLEDSPQNRRIFESWIR